MLAFGTQRRWVIPLLSIPSGGEARFPVPSVCSSRSRERERFSLWEICRSRGFWRGSNLIFFPHTQEFSVLLLVLRVLMFNVTGFSDSSQSSHRARREEVDEGADEPFIFFWPDTRRCWALMACWLLGARPTDLVWKLSGNLNIIALFLFQFKWRDILAILMRMSVS